MPGERQRRTGAFYTPEPWARRAHAALDAALPQWREWTVWDPACGTKNLVVGLSGNLILTTLDGADLEASADRNPGAVTAVYDFLGGEPVPDEVLAALGPRVLFLMNPPYASAANQDATHKAGVATNPVGATMRGTGPAAQQLYTQFLWRVMQLREELRAHGVERVAIGMFSSARFLGWPAFMERFGAEFGFRGGFYFNAAAFEDVADTWGIAFTMWDSAAHGGTMTLDLLAADGTPLGTKHIDPPGRTLSAWLKDATPRAARAPEPYVRLSTALKVNTSASPRGFLTEGSFGYLHNNADSVEHSARYVGLYSTAFGSANGVPVSADNFERACVVFAVRKSTVPPARQLWMTGHDTYQAPTRALPAAFVTDCVVYSLGSRSGSNQSALRGVQYAGHTLDVRNEFFWQGDTFVARWLASASAPSAASSATGSFSPGPFSPGSFSPGSFSPEAARVLDLLNTLVELTTAPTSPDLPPDLPPDAGFRQRLPLAPESWLADYADAFADLNSRVKQQALELGFLPSSIQLAP